MSNKSRADLALATVELIASALTVYMMVNVILGKDGIRGARLAVARAAENGCQRQAERWAHMADTCRRVYDSGISVTA